MPHPSDDLKLRIQANANEFVRLRSRIGETYALRDRNPEKLREWQRACEAFHARYNDLAFPGGYRGADLRILGGDPETVEAAICFLELRPYFFRSGYMFKAILSKAKRAPLNTEQAARLQRVIQDLAEYKTRVRAERDARKAR